MARSSGLKRLAQAGVANERNKARETVIEQTRLIDALRAQLQSQDDELAIATRTKQAEPYGAPQEPSVEEAEFYELPSDPNEDIETGELTLELVLAYNGNIAELVDDFTLTELGSSVKREFELDEASRREWLECAKESLKAATQKKPEVKNTPYPGASNVKYPLLTTACIQFAARAYPAIVRGDEVISAKVSGEDESGEKAKRAARSSSYANDQLIYRCTEWEPGTDSLLHVLPAIGKAFRKVYWDAQLKRPRLDYVSALDVVVPADAASLELAPRITHILRKYPYEVERMTMGAQPVWLKHDLSIHEGDDSQKPVEYLEQCRYADLDGDGFSEPYTVTIHRDTAKVVRIDPAFDIEDVTVMPEIDNETGETYPRVVAINRTLHWIDYDFLPDPEGGFYAMGFGQLLAPVSATIDTTINELIDAGHLANTFTGFIGGGTQFKGRSGELQLSPNKFKMLPGANDVRNAIYRMEFPGPNQTLFSLLEFLIGAAKDITSVKDVLTGEAPGSQPATSTLALIEQGQQVFSAIYKRIYRAMTREYALLYRLNKRYLSVEEYNKFLDAQPPQAEINAPAVAGGENAPLGAAPTEASPTPSPGMGGQVVPFPTQPGIGAGGPQADPMLAQNDMGSQPPMAGAGALPSAPPSAGGGGDMRQALMAQMPQQQAPQPQAQQYDPAIDFDTSDMDVRPVADPTAATEMQRLARAQFLLQFKGDPTVNTVEINKRAFEAARLSDPQKLIVESNPVADAMTQAQLQQAQAEAALSQANAALVGAQAQAAQMEPQLRQQEMQMREREMTSRDAEASLKQTDATVKFGQLNLQRGQLALEERRVTLEEARHMLEEHRAAMDEADRATAHERDAAKVRIEDKRATIDRLKAINDQALSQEQLKTELQRILADAEERQAEREARIREQTAALAHQSIEAEKDRRLEARKVEVNATLEAEKIKATRNVAKAKASEKTARDSERKTAPPQAAASNNDDALRATAQAIAEMAEAVRRSSGPKRIVRDEAGKIIGAEPIEDAE